MRWVRVLLSVSILAGLVGTSAPQRVNAGATFSAPITLTASEFGSYDITNTRLGQQNLQETVARLNKRYDLSKQFTDMRVLDLTGDGKDLLVIPRDTEEIRVVQQTEANGERRLDVAIATASLSRVDETSSAGIMSDWPLVATYCFSRLENTAAWIDHCYKLSKYSEPVNYGGVQRDLFALHHYSTAGPKGVYALLNASLWSDTHGESAPMQWVDWQPRSDKTGWCRTESLSFSYGGASVGLPTHACETWNITKYSSPGEFKNLWHTGAWGVRSDREVAYGVEVAVPVGQFPKWWLHAQVMGTL